MATPRDAGAIERDHPLLLRVTAPGSRGFCAGVVVAVDGYVGEAAPILRSAFRRAKRGRWSLEDVIQYCERRKWIVQVMREATGV